ncbi:DUF723 domain-containing protein [Vibrio owensii]|uniref:DUF723 domain-containing protein n=1 Tax=Vibrio owensii TaxID=696485 RepID=UPI003394120E
MAYHESSKEAFVRKAEAKHNGKYDYSRVVYEKNRIPVIIICPKHGTFRQRPESHLQGKGCPKCSIENRKKPGPRVKKEPSTICDCDDVVSSVYFWQPGTDESKALLNSVFR